MTSPSRRKPAPPKKAPPAASGPHIWIFDITKDQIPAHAVITVHAPTYREAVSAAYLLTESFTTDAIEFLKQ